MSGQVAAPGPGRDFDGCPKFCGFVIARAVLVVASAGLGVAAGRRVTAQVTGDDRWCCGPTLVAGLIGGAGGLAALNKAGRAAACRWPVEGR